MIYNNITQGRDMASQRLSSALSLVNLGGAGQGVRDSRCHVGGGGRGGVEGRDGGGTIFFYRGWTVLHLAARHSKPQTVRRLLDQVPVLCLYQVV